MILTTEEVITTTWNVISATTKCDIEHWRNHHSPLKVISATTKVILATEEVITTTLKVISDTTNVILATKKWLQQL